METKQKKKESQKNKNTQIWSCVKKNPNKEGKSYKNELHMIKDIDFPVLDPW